MRKIRQTQNMSIREKLLKEFGCLICREVRTQPMTTPCAHNFCKSCLEGAFVGKTFLRERSRGGRALRSQKNVMTCPSCPTDISDFLQNPQVNRELLDAVESLKSKIDEERCRSEKPCEDETDDGEENEDAPGAWKEDRDRDESNPNECGRPEKRSKVVNEEENAAVGPDGDESPSSPLHIRSLDDLE